MRVEVDERVQNLRRVPTVDSNPFVPSRGSVSSVATAPRPSRTKGTRDPTAISPVAVTTPSAPVRAHRPNIVTLNSIVNEPHAYPYASLNLRSNDMGSTDRRPLPSSGTEVSCAHRFPGYRVGGPGLWPAIAGKNGGVDTKRVRIAACFFRPLTKLLEKGSARTAENSWIDEPTICYLSGAPDGRADKGADPKRDRLLNLPRINPASSILVEFAFKCDSFFRPELFIKSNCSEMRCARFLKF